MNILRGAIARPIRLLLAACLAVLSIPAIAQSTAAEVVVQSGHISEFAQALAYSRDGKLLASAANEQGMVTIWDATSGREIRTLRTATMNIKSVSFSNDARELTVAGNAVEVLEVASGRQIRSLSGAGGLDALSPDGSVWAGLRNVGLSTYVLKIVDVASGRELHHIDAHPNASLVATAFSESGALIASLATEYPDQGTVRIWDVKSGRQIGRISLGTQKYGDLKAMAWSGNSVIATASRTEQLVRLWEVSTGKELKAIEVDFRTKQYPQATVDAMAISSDRGRLAVRDASNYRVKLIRLDTGGEVATFNQSAVPWNVPVFAPDGKSIALGGYQDLRIVDSADGKVVHALVGKSARVDSVRLAKDGRSLLLSLRGFEEDHYSATAALWDLATARVARTVPSRPPVQRSGLYFAPDDADLSPDGRYLASVDADGNGVTIVDAATQAQVRKFPVKDPLPWSKSLRFLPDSRHLAVWLTSGLALYDAVEGREIRTIKELSPAAAKVGYGLDGGFGFSADGRTIAVAQGNAITFWDVSSGSALRRIELPPDPGMGTSATEIWKIALSPDGSIVAAMRYDSIVLSEVATGRILRTLPAPQVVGSVVFSPDGTVLAVGGKRDITIWEVASGKELGILKGHFNRVASLGFSADGATLLSGSDDGTARLWNVRAGTEKAKLLSFRGGSSLIVVPEGYYNSSSAEAEENLNVRLGDQGFGISSYREKFFRPDLVALTISGRSIGQLARLDQVKPAPRIEFVDSPPTASDRQVSVRLRITDSGGGIGDIRLFVNGSAVVQETRNLAVQRASAAGEVRTYTLRLVRGRNELRAVAFNAENSMQSNPATAAINATFETSRPSLYGVVVGIQEFRNPRLKLNFPAADARLFADTLSKLSAPLYRKVELRLLTTPEETTRERLMLTLREMRGIVGPEDLFVFFVASHGIAEEGDYFLITSNVGSVSTDKLKTDALDQAHLKELLANIPATKKLIVIDTCNAGALGDALQSAFLTRGMSDATAMKILSRAVGSTVLSASTSVQQALEGHQGHGLFTYVVAEGLAGKADADKDGFVSTLELAAYVDDRVPALAEELFKHAQYPVVSPSGQGFPLAKTR